VVLASTLTSAMEALSKATWLLAIAEAMSKIIFPNGTLANSAPTFGILFSLSLVPDF
jgi:hypothetical protein